MDPYFALGFLFAAIAIPAIDLWLGRALKKRRAKKLPSWAKDTLNDIEKIDKT